MTSFRLGLDLGGTNVKWVVLEGEYKVERPLPASPQGGEEIFVKAKGQVPTDTSRGERSVVEQLVRIAGSCKSDLGRIDSVGVGVPGLYHPAAGTTRFMPNVPGEWEGVPVSAEVGAAVRAPAALINDARAFTLAEHRLGAGREARSMLGVTLGTGVGGGLILDGSLYLGHDGAAGEFGHQTIVPDGPPCNCGNRGCLEALTRADTIVAACGRPTVEKCVEAARNGDARALHGLTQTGRYLGIGVSNVLVLLSVDRVVVGGGVAAAGDLLLEPLRAELKERVFITDLERVKVVAAELGIWAGAIGAALHGAGAALAVG
jgi:glucokinase